MLKFEHRTKYVISKTDNLLSDLKDAETGQRGYLLTGDKAFLDPYLTAKDEINGHLKELDQIISDTTCQRTPGFTGAIDCF